MKERKKLNDNARIFNIFAKLQEANPNPTTELIYSNDFELLVAVILSAQATDLSVNKATSSLFNLVSSPEQMLELGEQSLKNYIKQIGLFNTKAKNIIAMSKILVEQYNSIVPDTMDKLINLPGVGRKTANVILNTLYCMPTIAVDTHVFRVSHRLKLSSGRGVDIVEQDLLKTIPTEFLQDAHHLLILHGRYVCKAKSPICNKCILNSLCPSALDLSD